MILLLQAGQLGNQLFQYIGLKKYFPKKKIIFLSHNNNIQPLFDNLDDNFIFVKKISLSFFQILQKLIIFLIKIRFLGVIYEDLTVKNYKITIKRGLFWGILVCYSNYFQHSDAITQIDSLPILKPEIRKKAFNWINQKKINIKKNKIVFIHIRRGDYLHWPSKEFPAALSINWYKQAMSLMKEKLQNPIFILMGDDLQFLRNSFKESNSIFISDNKPEIDLSIMSFCRAGILSSSSFSWWGAFYAKTYNKNDNFFIAPKYWIGHRMKKWIPENFYTQWITYIE